MIAAGRFPSLPRGADPTASVATRTASASPSPIAVPASGSELDALAEDRPVGRRDDELVGPAAERDETDPHALGDGSDEILHRSLRRAEPRGLHVGCTHRPGDVDEQHDRRLVRRSRDARFRPRNGSRGCGEREQEERERQPAAQRPPLRGDRREQLEVRERDGVARAAPVEPGPRARQRPGRSAEAAAGRATRSSRCALRPDLDDRVHVDRQPVVRRRRDRPPSCRRRPASRGCGSRSPGSAAASCGRRLRSTIRRASPTAGTRPSRTAPRRARSRRCASEARARARTE